jgi:hypothetical protein
LGYFRWFDFTLSVYEDTVLAPYSFIFVVEICIRYRYTSIRNIGLKAALQNVSKMAFMNFIKFPSLKESFFPQTKAHWPGTQATEGSK